MPIVTVTRWTCASAIVALAFLAAACGSSSNGPPTASPTPVPTAAITKDILARMPLPQGVFGNDYASFPIDPDSGYRTSAQFADDTTLDPNDTGTDVENSGWVATYQLEFTDASLAALSSGAGAFGAETEMDLFKDDASASAFVTKQLTDASRFVGQDVGAGSILESSSQFDDSTADPGFGLQEHITFGGTGLYGWIAGFRLGSLVATIQLARGDDSDLTASAIHLAQLLDQRVNSVIGGAIEDTPIPLPTPTPGGVGSAPRPDQGPFPDNMALDVADMPAGSSIKSQGYQPGGAEYERDFDMPSTSPYSEIDNRVDLFQSTDAATQSFAGQKALYTSGSASAFFDSVFQSEQLPFDVSNTTVTQVNAAAQGDDSFAIMASYDSPAGRFENEFVIVRVGPVIDMLITTELVGGLNQPDIDTLASAMVVHTRAELANPGASPNNVGA